MNFIRIYRRNLFQNVRLLKNSSEPPNESNFIPQYPTHESLDVKRSRLLYQSRKRGILENCLLLSTFAADNLNKMDSRLLQQYDELLKTSNEWDLYYWVSGTRDVPDKYNNDVMTMLKNHVKKNERRLRSSQPDVVPP
ncbi:hypothetical protein O3M35_005326 [Rhynocoris fuscipes]|uniref:Succinate dehydrogenase assembly factor 2, mitochondrial n=1 Tax=Rhynocoris fuscipes TaxID=488301 RepID=A0AAW1DQ24_9HEMI